MSIIVSIHRSQKTVEDMKQQIKKTVTKGDDDLLRVVYGGPLVSFEITFMNANMSL